MIDLQQLYEWRWVDPINNLVLPYYTRPCLDWLLKQDLDRKRIFEYGCGASTVWYDAKRSECFGVESNKDWRTAVINDVPDAKIILCETPELYAQQILYSAPFDIVIVDGIERDDCIPIAIKSLVPEGVLVIDNWCQPSAYMPSKPIQQLVESMNHIIYPQPGHPDWQTLVATA